MSSNTSEAATTAIDQESQENQTSNAGQDAQASPTATTNNDSQVNTPSSQAQGAGQQTSITRQEGGDNPTPSIGQPAQGGQSAPTEQQGESGQTQQGESGQTPRHDQGIQNSAVITGGTDPHADDTARMASEPKPDVSDQDFQELLPKLLNHFHNNREELARAVGLHRSTVDRWLNGKSRPNNSTVLRMRRLAQERRIE